MTKTDWTGLSRNLYLSSLRNSVRYLRWPYANRVQSQFICPSRKQFENALLECLYFLHVKRPALCDLAFPRSRLREGISTLRKEINDFTDLSQQ